jgi:hypothetical protein
MLWALADPALNAYVGSSGTVGRAWPAVRQVWRVERQRTVLRRGQVVKVEREITYGITSRGPRRAPARTLLRWLRGHWRIENCSHWVRDVTWDEDRSQIRSGAAPQTFAACRNLAATLLRRAGVTNLAAALRTLAGRPHLAIQLVASAGCS